MLCSFVNDRAVAAFIQGADGGASVAVGNRSYWFFGDTLLIPQSQSSRQIVPNSLAWSAAGATGHCPSLHYLQHDGVAASFLEKEGSLTVWPSGAWRSEDGLLELYTVYVYGVGPFNYHIGEVGLARLDTGTMHVEILSRGLWSAESGFESQVVSAQPVDVDGDGYLRVILGTLSGDQLLGRVRPEGIARADAYQYWDGTAWSRDRAAAAPLWQIPHESDPVSRLATFTNGASVAYNGYLGEYVAVENVGFDKIGARVARRLEGPWSAPTIWIDCSAIAQPAVPVCYSPYQHPELSSSDGRTLLITFTRMATYDVVAYEVTLGDVSHSLPTSATVAVATPTP